MHEQINGSSQRLNAARKASRLARQPCQVMPQISIRSFYRVGLALVPHRCMLTPVAQLPIGVERITVVASRRWRLINDRLQEFRRAPEADLIGHDAGGRSIYDRADVGWFFLLP